MITNLTTITELKTKNSKHRNYKMRQLEREREGVNIDLKEDDRRNLIGR